MNRISHCTTINLTGLICILLLCIITSSEVFANSEKALDILDKSRITQSSHWPHVTPEDLHRNLQENILHPERIYQGSATNFCGYAAFTYLLVKYQPEKYLVTIIDLYQNGTAVCGKQKLQPSKEIRNLVGTIAGKGKLDIHVADQLFFYTLADQVKGYLNIADKKYDPGNENTIWAATNLKKFKRMVSNMMETPVILEGGDILRPEVGNNFQYLQHQLEQGKVVLFVNSKYLYPSRNYIFKLRAPTHFIVLHKIVKHEGTYFIDYWDYGYNTFQAMDKKMFRKLIFGIITIHTNSL